jgi:hypothetical protein
MINHVPQRVQPDQTQTRNVETEEKCLNRVDFMLTGIWMFNAFKIALEYTYHIKDPFTTMSLES